MPFAVPQQQQQPEVDPTQQHQQGYASRPAQPPQRRATDPWAQQAQRGYGMPQPQRGYGMPQRRPQPQPAYQPPREYGMGRGYQQGPSRQPQNQYYQPPQRGRDQYGRMGAMDRNPYPPPQRQAPSYGANLVAGNGAPQGAGIYGQGWGASPMADYRQVEPEYEPNWSGF